MADAQTASSVSPAMPLPNLGPSLGKATAPDPYHELETKYIFGFTEDADIGAEGERAIELETTTELGLRGGTYGIVAQELEFEGVPSQYWGYELSAHVLGFSVRFKPKPTLGGELEYYAAYDGLGVQSFQGQAADPDEE